MEGRIVGTPHFMAPEQAEGRLDAIDARTDIFALGGILYNILALRPPVSGDSVQDVLQKIRTGEIAPPSPTPLIPSGLRGDGVSRWAVSISGTSMDVGTR